MSDCGLIGRMPDIEGNAKRFRDALLITVESRNNKAKDDIEGNAKRFRDALLITVESRKAKLWILAVYTEALRWTVPLTPMQRTRRLPNYRIN